MVKTHTQGSWPSHLGEQGSHLREVHPSVFVSLCSGSPHLAQGHQGKQDVSLCQLPGAGSPCRELVCGPKLPCSERHKECSGWGGASGTTNLRKMGEAAGWGWGAPPNQGQNPGAGR